MKKTLAVVLSAMLMLGMVSFSALAFEKTPPGNGPGLGEPGLEAREFRPGMGLDLNEEQQQQVAEIRKVFEKETIDLRYDLQQKQRELRSLWAADALNEAAINEKSNEVNTLRIQLITKSRAMLDQLKAVLTPEQQEQLEKRFENGRPGGPGRRDMRCPF